MLTTRSRLRRSIGPKFSSMTRAVQEPKIELGIEAVFWPKDEGDRPVVLPFVRLG